MVATILQLRASRDLPPDALDLFGEMKDAGEEMLSASRLAYDMHDIKHRVPADTLASVRAAAEGVIRAIDRYEAGR